MWRQNETNLDFLNFTSLRTLNINIRMSFNKEPEVKMALSLETG